MKEPHIRYARTSDGVNIAFWTLGEGEPLVCMPLTIWGTCQLEWEWPEWRAWYERLASTRMLIRYDWRGTGLSDRHVSDLSSATPLLDLDAVIERLGIQTFRLLGNYMVAPSALTYTAQHRERVSAPLLWCPVV